MSEFWQFNIFPPGALQSSVVTTVWVGVCIVVFLNARFGTTLAGLVVPGYLVPLFFVKPVSAIVVLFEAYITYGLALLFANKLLVKFGYSEMFGRDRFFALILLSVLVRIVLDFFALPFLLSHYGEYLGEHDLKNNLQSFGLIIVALIANQMWMGGVIKGSKALFLYLGLTFAVIYWILIPLTNFNIGGLNYMYEDLATSLLSSPKAYIILLTTAFIASRMNLQFGWEFNGILIPALLALQWYQPEKLLFTFLEAGVILALGVMAMRTPIFKRITFEGGRLLLLFFNIGFLYKILLGFALIEFLPTAKISDYYGFGYVVSTLIAIKIYQKRIALKMAVSTVFTSFVGIALATIAGFFLTFSSLSSQTEIQDIQRRPVQFSDKALLPLFNEVRASSLYSNIRTENLTHKESEQLQLLLHELQKLTTDNRLARLAIVNQLNEQLNMDIWLIQDDVMVLHKQGKGFYAIRLPRPNKTNINNNGITENDITENELAKSAVSKQTQYNDLVIQVPAARAELGAASLGLAMFEKTHARALFIDLSYQLQTSGDYVFDSLLENGWFQQFHKTFAAHNVLQLRGDLKITEQRKKLRQSNEVSSNRLAILRTAPDSLPITLINSIASNVQMLWLDLSQDNVQAHSQGYSQKDVQEPWHNPQWQHDGFGIAELHLNNKEMRSALARIAVFQTTSSDNSINNLEGYLINWLLDRKSFIARKGSEEFQVPTQNQLLFWHQDILMPLMQWLKNHEITGWDQQLRDELQRLNVQASSVGYEFRVLQQPVSGNEFLILQEQDAASSSGFYNDGFYNDSPRKNWATLVVNLNAQSEYLVTVPNPFFEKTSFEFGSVLFRQLQNRFLLLSGTHPWANPDGSSNVTLTGNKNTLYHVLFMAITREYENRQMTPVQVRGFSFQESRPFPKEHALISLWQNINQYQPSGKVDTLLQQLDDIGLNYRFVDGDHNSAPYYISTNQQIDYLDYVDLDEFLTLWISPLTRDSFKATDEIKIEEQHARLLGLTIFRDDIRTFSIANKVQRSVNTEIIAQLSAYASRRNVHHLNNANLRLTNGQLIYLLDSSSLQQFILYIDENGDVIAGINLNSLNNRQLSNKQSNALEVFVQSRYRWLLPDDVKVGD